MGNSKYYKSDDDDPKSTVTLEGYIDETRTPPVFIVTNYQECVDAGILGYIPDKKSEEEDERQHKNIKELLKKYKPKFIKENI